MEHAEEEFAAPNAADLEGEAAALGLPTQAAATSADEGPWSVIARQSDALMRIDGVVMVGLGSTEIGDQAILVGVRRADQLATLPSVLDGMPVRGQIVGEVDALADKPRRGRRQGGSGVSE